jgi:hypothetical protein
MSFTLPTFNLLCNVWTGTAPPPGARRAQFPCNLAWGRRVNTSLDSVGAFWPTTILLPALADIRTITQTGVASGNDVVEVPAGSGRYYVAEHVDDIGKGFSNEHRGAILIATRQYGDWPTPIP